MAEALGESASGFALAPHGAQRGRLPATIELLHASHPVPDTTGLAASRKILRAVSALGEGDWLLCLISGGASSLFEVPDRRVSDQELIALYDALVRSGGDIHQINAVRSALSSVKGGRLAAAAAPAKVITLAISDVAGDDPATIG
jgi:glycerate 2-kinase